MTTCSKKQTTQKYTSRNSPAYPASECKNMKKKGNDGKFYKSTADKNGVFKWHIIETGLTRYTRHIKERCKKQTTQKYVSRNSPAYPAGGCPDMKKKGNDGKFYLSTPDVNGVYKWKSV